MGNRPAARFPRQTAGDCHWVVMLLLLLPPLPVLTRLSSAWRLAAVKCHSHVLHVNHCNHGRRLSLGCTCASCGLRSRIRDGTMFDSCKDGGGDAGRRDSGGYSEAKLQFHQQSCLFGLSFEPILVHPQGGPQETARVATWTSSIPPQRGVRASFTLDGPPHVHGHPPCNGLGSLISHRDQTAEGMPLASKKVVEWSGGTIPHAFDGLLSPTSPRAVCGEELDCNGRREGTP
ncbi:hypothetical protein J3F83DRAFT_11844 [Trichoderma novae-zelandiae]